MKKGTDFWTRIFRLRQFKIGQIWTDKEQNGSTDPLILYTFPSAIVWFLLFPNENLGSKLGKLDSKNNIYMAK